MGVYIKGLEMPKFCKSCRFCVNMNEYPFLACFITQKGIPFDTDKMENCPLVEIVTCGECNRSGTDGENIFCMWLGALRNPTDFCSYGERKK